MEFLRVQGAEDSGTLVNDEKLEGHIKDETLKSKSPGQS